MVSGSGQSEPSSLGIWWESPEILEVLMSTMWRWTPGARCWRALNGTIGPEFGSGWRDVVILAGFWSIWGFGIGLARAKGCPSRENGHSELRKAGPGAADGGAG